MFEQCLNKVSTAFSKVVCYMGIANTQKLRLSETLKPSGFLYCDASMRCYGYTVYIQCYKKAKSWSYFYFPTM